MTTGRINQISIGVLGATTLKRGIQPNNVSLMIVCCFFCLCNTVFFAYQKGANFHCTALRGRVFHVDLFFRLKFPRNAATIKYRFPFNQVSSCRNRSSALNVLRGARCTVKAHTHHTQAVQHSFSLGQSVAYCVLGTMLVATRRSTHTELRLSFGKGLFWTGGPKRAPQNRSGFSRPEAPI